jgi:hypothetical protein
MRPSDRQQRFTIPILLAACAAGAFIGCSGESGGGGVTVQPADIVVSAKTPPPITGGTLLVAKDGKTAVAADPDRDRIWIVDLETQQAAHVVELKDGDEPGRVVEDGAGRVHVALRRGGALVDIDPASGKILDRRAVCPAPRGVAYDPNGDRLHVACAGGELVTLPAAGGEPTRTLRLERDLRDVVVSGNRLIVSKFRSADVLRIEADGKVLESQHLPSGQGFRGSDFTLQPFSASVAWRTVARPGGGVVVVHQRGMDSPVVVSQPGGYGGSGCGDTGIVQGTVTEVPTENGTPGGPLQMPVTGNKALSNSALPVDVAVSPDGSQFVVVAAGTNALIRNSFAGVVSTPDQPEPQPCDPGTDPGTTMPGQPTAVAFRDSTNVVVQLREPAALFLPDKQVTILLPGESRMDTGHELFHKAPQGMGSLACASCHPEGGDDARTWNFDPIGARRTQTVGIGNVTKTAPLHWDGDMAGMDNIMSEVFVNRMGGTPQGPRHIRLISRWVDSIKRMPISEPADTGAVARGKAIFEDANVGCASCHNGAELTDNKNQDVGTGKAFQVPTLVGIADRAPYMHTGCAATLTERFDPAKAACTGGDQHGRTSQLSKDQISDLVAYLESL